MPKRRYPFFFAILVFQSVTFARLPENTEFRAQRYIKDLSTNTAKGTGNAWLRSGERQVRADTIEVDYNTGRATANGHVYLKDGEIEAWGSHASINLNGEDATLENATLLSGQMMMTGVSIRRFGGGYFEIDHGTYSNCNLKALKVEEVTQCTADWKVSGNFFAITVEKYAHVRDALVFIRDVPVLYSPYFIFPVKTKRSSGLLWPKFVYSGNVGTGLVLPLFLALGPWHDLTLTPTYFSSAGLHLGLEYRYLYSHDKRGTVELFLSQRQYGDNPDLPLAGQGPKRFGFFGEGAVQATQLYGLGGRTIARQTVRLVSHRYYTFDFPTNFGSYPNLGYLRSVVSITHPADQWLFAGHLQYHQYLLASKDYGSDRGAVAELPALFITRPSSRLLPPYFSYEWDLRVQNFFRDVPYDSVPLSPAIAGPQPATGRFAGNDYLRTGQRIWLEPRLVANVPLPTGIQLQPILRGGVLGYRFPLPQSETLSRQYVDIEVPFSLYLNRTFETSLPGLDRVSHVIQPRVIYGKSLYQTPEPTHPFFYRNRPTGFRNLLPLTLSSPRFDLWDQLYPYEYVRFELLNRFHRKSGDSVSRFLRLQISEQYNIGVTPADPRYTKRLGPVEVLAELSVGAFSAQFQANYGLEKTTSINGLPAARPIKENDVSGSVTYNVTPIDSITVGTLFRTRADPSLDVQNLNLRFHKSLPILLDIHGNLEYSFLSGGSQGFRGYSIGFHLRNRPTTCWEFALITGRDNSLNPFLNFEFRFFFGDPGSTFRNL